MNRRRLLALGTALILTLASTGTASAANVPRLPTSAADWMTFSPQERKAALDYEETVFRQLLASGNAVVHSNAAATSNSLTALTVTVTYQCPIQWINLPQGSEVRGGGWTDASASMSTIYASYPGTYIGKFYRDGVVIDYWYSYLHDTNHAESWTGYNFKWWFEHPNYFNSGYHGAQQYAGGAWQLGPNQYCSTTASP